jgi:hypothetical protein
VFATSIRWEAFAPRHPHPLSAAIPARALVRGRPSLSRHLLGPARAVADCRHGSSRAQKDRSGQRTSAARRERGPSKFARKLSQIDRQQNVARRKLAAGEFASAIARDFAAQHRMHGPSRAGPAKSLPRSLASSLFRRRVLFVRTGGGPRRPRIWPARLGSSRPAWRRRWDVALNTRAPRGRGGWCSRRRAGGRALVAWSWRSGARAIGLGEGNSRAQGKKKPRDRKFHERTPLLLSRS